jgi:hypothetical protein
MIKGRTKSSERRDLEATEAPAIHEEAAEAVMNPAAVDILIALRAVRTSTRVEVPSRVTLERFLF